MSQGVAGEGREKPAWTGTSYTMFSAYQYITQVEEKELFLKSRFFRKPALARHGCGSNSRGGSLGMFACTHSLLQLRQHLLSTSAVEATGCLGTVHCAVQLFAWVVNSRACLANSEGLFCHTESNHRGNSIMRKPRHTFHHLAALLCLLFLPRPLPLCPSSSSSASSSSPTILAVLPTSFCPLLP